jgi:hypothetical protein
MWGEKPKPTEAGQAGTKPILPAQATHPDSEGSGVCCGKPMAPQFRHARDHDGRIMFVALWRCSSCGRITL